MIQTICQFTATAISVIADSFAIRDRLAGQSNNLVRTADTSPLPEAVIEIFVQGHSNAITFQSVAPAIPPPQLSLGGHAQRLAIPIPTNVTAHVYVSGHANTISVPATLRPRVFTSTRGHSNYVA